MRGSIVMFHAYHKLYHVKIRRTHASAILKNITMNPCVIVIPTYNESQTIAKIIRAIAAEKLPADVLVVDDNSPDGTADVVRGLQKEYSFVRLLVNPVKDGLARAYMAGFSHALAEGYKYICEMDADFSHNPRYLRPMLEALETCDFVVGSRYVKNGGVRDWSLPRRIISRAGSLYAQGVLGSPIRDQTGGFNMWRRETLEAIMPQVTSRGYVFQVELKYRARKAGFRGTEVPIVFTDRTEGVSKMTGSIIKEAVSSVLALRFGRRQAELALFCCVGGAGMLINLALFWLLTDAGDVPPTLASVICFCITVVINYALNHLFTFQVRTRRARLSAGGVARYASVALIGLGINITLLNIALALYPFKHAVFAQAIGIIGGMMWNFLGASKFVFNAKRFESRS